jgi:PadR family transcriptional regulator PadR
VPDESTWPAQWLRGVLELCVLAVVDNGRTYGYAIAQRLETAGLGRIKGGTLYPILLRLEQDGLVTAAWGEGSGGPGRKFYEITRAGGTELRRRRQDWAAFTATAAALLDTVDAGAHPRGAAT